MFFVTTNGQDCFGEFVDFDAALMCALDVAIEMAENRDYDPDDVDTFVNGTPGEYPTCNREDAITWEAGACPSECDGAYWPHVEWR